MTFDLKRCMDEDAGKCICRSNGKVLPARIFCDDLKDDKNSLAVAVDEYGSESLFKFHSNGSYDFGERINLENMPILPKTHEVWTEIVKEKSTGIITVKSKLPSDEMHKYDFSNVDILSITKHTITEGEGLDGIAIDNPTIPEEAE